MNKMYHIPLVGAIVIVCGFAALLTDFYIGVPLAIFYIMMAIGNGVRRSSAILGPGRYELARTESKNGEQPLSIVLESLTDLESLELRTEWTLKPLDQTFLLLKRMDFSKMPDKRRKRGSLYTSGNRVSENPCVASD